MKLGHTVIAMLFIFAVSASAKSEYFVAMCVCAGIYMLGMIASEISELVEQKKRGDEELLRTLESIAMEMLKSLNKDKN